MKARSRNIEKAILADLQKKFVFLSGPRQVGKTTLAKTLIKKKKGTYLLYDDPDDRQLILQRKYTAHPWVCLDEFHKFPRWKSQIKGVYDKYHEKIHLLLTGSARLDMFQKSGDSLFGRYFLHHLHPFSVGELTSKSLPPLFEPNFEPHKPTPLLPELLKFGGFPEPYYAQSEREHRRWSNARRQLLIREDLRELTQVELVGLIEQLMILLPERIGSTFSFHALSEDIRTSPATIKNWMSIFQRLFIVFPVLPYSKRITRAIQKQPKYYFYDWSQVLDEGSQFENLVASHLWKATQVWMDLGYANLSVQTIRDRDRREVDFLMVRENKPWFLVEAKLSDTRPSKDLEFFSNRLQIPGIQLVLKNNVYKKSGRITVISANQWLEFLP